MKVAVVSDVFPHSSVAVNTTVTLPVNPQPFDKVSKLLLQVISPHSSFAEAPPLLFNH